MQEFFFTTIYQPIYNALAFLVSVVPGGDVGVAIILLTSIIKLILFPLSLSAARTQIAMRALDPELRKIKKELKNQPEALAKKTLALFKEKKVNPFSSILLILIQLPIIIGLYFVFLKEGSGASFDPATLYPFISLPSVTSFSFLGLIDLVGSSVILAVLVGISQYYVSLLTMPPTPPPDDEPSFQNDFMKSMHIQMKYVFPVVMVVVAYVISAAVALYFLVSNLFMIGQELYVRHTHKEKTP